MKAVEARRAPKTVKIDDGKGGFLTLNKGDFNSKLHKLFVKPELKKPEPKRVVIIDKKDYSVEELKQLLLNAGPEEVAELEKLEKQRNYPRKGALALFREAKAEEKV